VDPVLLRPSVSIVVLTFNRADMLGRLLQALDRLQGPDIELIVVDNHSEDGTPEVVAATAPRCTYLRTESNLGVGARNIGLRRAAGDLIVCLDDDVFGIDEHAIAALGRAFDADASLGAINFRVLDPYTRRICNWVHHCTVEEFADRTFDTYEITEGAVAFRRSAIEAAGYYPDYFFLSHEGPDLAFRMMDAGYRVEYRGTIQVEHWHASAGRKPGMCHYYDTRNQYWLAARNFPAGYALRYLARGQASTFVYAVRDGFLGHWLRAVRDGVAGAARAWRDRKAISPATMTRIRDIDARRAPFLYMAKARLFQKDMRL
jgi:GT2 family glycosyltransferase